MTGIIKVMYQKITIIMTKEKIKAILGKGKIKVIMIMIMNKILKKKMKNIKTNLMN
jgi:hypothetical protein